MFHKRLNDLKTLSGAPLNKILQTACAVILLTGALSACSSNTEKAEDVDASSKSSTDDELEDLDDSATIAKKKVAKPPKPKLNTEGKKTGEMVDGYEFDQQNEFLGLTKLRLSKYGVRLESPNIICIMLPGQEAIAYNAQNGNSMQLTAKSAAMLAGKRPNEGPSEEVVEAIKGTQTIATLKCNKYVIHKFFPNQELAATPPAGVKAPKPKLSSGKPRTMEQLKKDGYIEGWHTDIWATKDIGVPLSIMKDCARLTMMPPELGFPVRIERQVSGGSGMQPPNLPNLSKSSAAATTAKPADNAPNSRRRYVIDTKEVHKTKFDKGNFAQLTGFKQVKDEMQLMMSGDDSELEGLGLDDDDKPGKSRSKSDE